MGEHHGHALVPNRSQFGPRVQGQSRLADLHGHTARANRDRWHQHDPVGDDGIRASRTSDSIAAKWIGIRRSIWQLSKPDRR